MAEPFAVPNDVEGVLGTEFVLGTDTSVKLSAIGLFDTGGGHVRVQTTDGAHWCLLTYTGVTTNDLTGATQAGLSGKLYSTGDGTYTFPVGSYVYRVCMGEDVSKRIMGPASATDGHLLVADGTSGKKAKDGGAPFVGTPVQENSVGVVSSATTLNFMDMNVEDGTGGLANIYVDRAAPCAGRLTLTTGVPVTTADVTAATTLYFTPYNGRKVGLFDGTRWQDYNFAEMHIHLTDVLSCVVANGDATVTTPANGTRGLVAGQEVTGAHIPGATTVLSITDSTHFEMSANATGDATEDLTFKLPASKVYDVFLWNDAGTLRLEWGPEWTSSTARATDIAWQDGIYVKNGATTRRYLGTIYTTATAGQTEDSISKRFVWNYYNRMFRNMYWASDANDHTYTVATWRQWNADAAAHVDFVMGVWDQKFYTAFVRSEIMTSDATKITYIGLGFDATNAAISNQGTIQTGRAVFVSNMFADSYSSSLLGAHYFAFVELQQTVATGTYNGGRLYAIIQG